MNKYAKLKTSGTTIFPLMTTLYWQEIQKYKHGTNESRHFLIVKWIFVSFFVAVTCLYIGYKFSFVGYIIMVPAIISAVILMFIGVVNFFSKQTKEYKKVKQPWD